MSEVQGNWDRMELTEVGARALVENGRAAICLVDRTWLTWRGRSWVQKPFEAAPKLYAADAAGAGALADLVQRLWRQYGQELAALVSH